jgi:cysteine synthase
MSRSPDWTKTGTIAGYAEYLRGKSDALAVIVIRVNDSALAADPLLAPEDIRERVTSHLPGLILDLVEARKEKRKAARQQLGELHE